MLVAVAQSRRLPGAHSWMSHVMSHVMSHIMIHVKKHFTPADRTGDDSQTHQKLFRQEEGG